MFIAKKILLTVAIATSKINDNVTNKESNGYKTSFFSFLPLFLYKSFWNVGLFTCKRSCRGNLKKEKSYLSFCLRGQIRHFCTI